MELTTLIGYFILIVFFSIERRLRRGEEARSFEAGKDDQRSTRVLGYAYFISMLTLVASWLLNAFSLARFPAWIAWLGVLLALGGLLLRAWANLVLGSFYTRTLKTTEGHTVVHDGPYRWIRHPGYLGMILLWGGAAAATGNWIVLAVVLVVICAAYHYRIRNEEAMLLNMLPEYAAYRAHTWRLLPPLY